MSTLHPLILESVNDDRKYDPWGSAMRTLGDLCDALSAMGEGSSIPASAGYRPAMGFGESCLDFEEYHGARMFVHATDLDTYRDEFVDMDELDIDEMVRAVEILDRYCDWVRAAGRDY